MRTDRIVFAIVIVLSAGFVIGCSNASDSAGAATQVKQPSATKMGAGDNVDQSGAKVISDPKQVQQGGSYKLQPPDPNNAHFKPDPKLGGGG